MDLATAERLISASDPKDLSALKKLKNDPVAAKAVAAQFAALLMQNVMEGSDGTAMPMAGDGIGGNIVSGLFASAVSQAAASGDKRGLADLLFRSIEAKQHAGDAGDAPGTAGNAARDAPTTLRAHAQGFSLRPYWQDNGGRPLASATAAGRPGAISGGEAVTNAIAVPGRPASMLASLSPSISGSMRSPSVTSNELSGPSAGPRQVQSFVRQLRPMLVEAGRQLGVSPRILLAHAALETGWGRSVVGNNLFGIKAGSSWQGEQVTTTTHEVEAGERVAREAAFRAYPSLDASVQDYVALIGGDARYQGLIGSGDDVEAYGRGLVAGGYATDTDYGSKLEAVAAEAAAAFATPSEPEPLGFYGAAEPAATLAAPGRPGHLGLFATPGSME